jgi:hypothetical protein
LTLSSPSSTTNTSMDINFRIDQLQNFIRDWEIESTERVIQQILILVGISRYSTPISGIRSGTHRRPHLLSLPNLHLPQLIEIIIELLGDERHGVTTIMIQEKCIQLLTDCVYYINNYHRSIDGPSTGVSDLDNPTSISSSYQLHEPMNYDYVAQGLEKIFELLFSYAESSSSSASLDISNTPLNSSITNQPYLMKASANYSEYIYSSFTDSCFHFILLLLSLHSTHYTIQKDQNMTSVSGKISGGVGGYVTHDVSNQIAKYRKIVMSHLDRLHSSIFQRPGCRYNAFLVLSLELSKNLLPSIKRMNFTQEVILFSSIYQALSSRSPPLIISCCQFFNSLPSANLLYVITRIFSRNEIESFLLSSLQLSSSSPYLFCVVCRTMELFLIAYNPSPYWVAHR